MREILFRGKRKGDNKWVYGSFARYNLEDGTADMFLPEYGVLFSVHIDTLGQFTGLTANGTKIFEGDIVKDGDTQGIVTFGKHRIPCCGCCYQYHNTIGFYVDDGKGNIFSDEDTWNDFEVIGNIHDNPELMEVQDER